MNEKLHSVRSLICSTAGAVGSLLASLFGGWSSDLSTLVIFMAVDFATGIAAAALCRSGKTKTGGLSSAAGWRGLTKKIMTLLLVVVAHRMDLILQIDYIKTAAVIAFTLNEAISIIENAGLIGIPMPKVLIQAVDLLKGRARETESK